MGCVDILEYLPPNLRCLVLVYFTDTQFLMWWLFKSEEYLLRISERNTTGITCPERRPMWIIGEYLRVNFGSGWGNGMWWCEIKL